MRMDRLTGRAAVITGGASGIGLASALAFAQDGASVALVDRDVHALERAAKQFATTPLLLDGDVGDEAVVTAHAVAVQQQFGRLDILMACAGWSAGLSVADSDLTSWEAVLRTNLTGSFLWSRAAIPLMRAIGGGAIILVGSQLAFAGGRANAAYLAAKGAIPSLARSMALDHAAEGIRVNVVVPGAIDTPLLQHGFRRGGDATAARAARWRDIRSAGSAGRRKWRGRLFSWRATIPRLRPAHA